LAGPRRGIIAIKDCIRKKGGVEKKDEGGWKEVDPNYQEEKT